MLAITLVVSLIILAAGCRHRSDPSPSGHPSGPSSATGEATGLRIEREGDVVRVTVTTPWQKSGGAGHIWYLVPHGRVLPVGVNEGEVIRVPISRIVCMSTTHIAMLRALEAENLIVGISGTTLVYDSLIRKAISRGEIADVGYEASLDKELIISLAPDLVMAYGITGPVTGSMARLSETGVKVFYNAEHLESHPLARSEWIRLFGLLAGKEAMADSIVVAVTASYHELTMMVDSLVTRRPLVLLGAPWEDVWYISPSDSYTGRLINDAGGEYLYSELRGANPFPMSVESVFRKAAGAEIWINPGEAASLQAIAAADRRLAALPLFSGGRVWNNRLRTTATGGNDYWESAVVRPDRLLSDFIAIIHPELMPGYEYYYYRRVE